MNTIVSKTFFLLLILAISAGCQTKKEQANTPPPVDSTVAVSDTLESYAIIERVKKRMVVEEIQSYNMVSITYRGSYVQHPDAFSRLQDYVFANYAAVGNCIGFYPFDPDATPFDKLVWDIGLRVIPGSVTDKHEMLDSKSTDDPFAVKATAQELNAPLTKLPQPKTPFKLTSVPATLAMSLVTTVEDAGKEGLALNALLDILGYVQTGVTRTEYAMENRNPMKVRVKISIPIVERKSGLKL